MSIDTSLPKLGSYMDDAGESHPCELIGMTHGVSDTLVLPDRIEVLVVGAEVDTAVIARIDAASGGRGGWTLVAPLLPEIDRLLIFQKRPCGTLFATTPSVFLGDAPCGARRFQL